MPHGNPAWLLLHVSLTFCRHISASATFSLGKWNTQGGLEAAQNPPAFCTGDESA
jgi:hypothetical protein